jgi:hypothetical protein
MPGPHPPATAITSGFCPGVIGVSGIALAAPAAINVLARKAAAISLVIGMSPRWGIANRRDALPFR